MDELAAAIYDAIERSVTTLNPYALSCDGSTLAKGIEQVAEARAYVIYTLYQRHRDAGMSATDARRAVTEKSGISGTRLLKVIERGSAISRDWIAKEVTNV